MTPIEESTFDEMLADATGLVLVDFWADWCGPCRAVTPVLEALAGAYEGRVGFFAVNADENRQLMDAFGVRSLPTVILLKPNVDGPGAKVVGHSVGAKSQGAFAKMIDDALNPKPGLMKRLGNLFGGAN
jgi:thioredoxin 1